MTSFGGSGTQKGMTDPQCTTFIRELLNRIRMWDTWSHGSCIGFDAESDQIVRNMKAPVLIAIHPPTSQAKRAPIVPRPYFDHVYPEKPYIERNHNIVDNSDFMFFCPSSMSENQRSGTWATIRYAQKIHKPFMVIWPDGLFTLQSKEHP